MTNINDIPLYEMSRELQKLDPKEHDGVSTSSCRTPRPVFHNPGLPGWIINLWNGKNASYRYLIVKSNGSTLYSRQPEEDEITGESNIPTWFGRWSVSNDGDMIWLQLTVMDGISASWPDSCLYLHAYKLLDPDLKKRVDSGDELLPCKMDVDRIVAQADRSHGDGSHLPCDSIGIDIDSSSSGLNSETWVLIYEGYALDLNEAQELMESAAMTGDWTGDRLKELTNPIPHTYSDFQVNGVKVPIEAVDWLTGDDTNRLSSSRIVDHKEARDMKTEDNEWNPSSWRDLPPFLMGLDVGDDLRPVHSDFDGEEHGEFWSKADPSLGPVPVAYEFSDEDEDDEDSSESYK